MTFPDHGRPAQPAADQYLVSRFAALPGNRLYADVMRLGYGTVPG